MSDQDLLSDAVAETEKEILNEAFQDEPAQANPEAETEQPVVTDRARDETGKFVAKTETPVTVTDKPAAEKPSGEPADDDKAQVPSWRLREVAEEKRQLAKERDELKSNLAQMQSRLSTLEKPAQQPKQEDIDPLLDPQGFAKRIESSFEQRLSEERLNNNLALAHVRHGDKFEKAYQALIAEAQSGNRQIVPQLTSQANPGEAIVRWFNDRETLKEVGTDPAAYKQKLQDELLKNPEFLAKAIEAARANAGQQQRPNNVTRMPPSLSRATGSAHNVNPEDFDDSEKGIFDYATRS